MYYVKTVSRIIGWLFILIGIVGLWYGHIGEYFHFTQREIYSSLLFGIFFTYGARRRERIALIIAVSLGILLLLWCISTFVPSLQLGTGEPLEFLLRMLAGIWALYASIQDILIWRNQDIFS